MPTASVKETRASLLQDASNNLPESIVQTQYPYDREPSRNSSMISRYLLENVEEFRRLTELRKQVDESSAKTLGQFPAVTLTNVGMEQSRRRSILPKATS
jgi:hypothetical protein